MSVFRFGSVGPNCEFNLFLERIARFATRKGKRLIFRYYSIKGFLIVGGDTNMRFILWLIVELNKLLVFF